MDKRSIESFFIEKSAQRKKNACMSFEDKIKVVVRLQKIAQPILAQRGIPVTVWDLEEATPDRC